jgi:hypothetical protein
MKALDTEMKLSGRTVVFTPVKYLIPIKNAVSNAPLISESGRTCPKQGPDTANGWVFSMVDRSERSSNSS